MTVKVGFAGTGFIAKEHLKRLVNFEDVQISAFYDANNESAVQISKQYGGKPYKDFHEMIENENLDALYVCVPPYAHTDQEILAAKKGINLFIEKPIALSMEKANEINKVITKTKVISSVGHMYRYLPIVEEAKKILGNDKISLVHGEFFCPFVPVPWWRNRETSGGQIVEQTTHIFDIVRYLVGEVKEVFARGYKGLMKDIENYNIEDSSMVSLQFENGAIGNISSTCLITEGWSSKVKIIAKGKEIDLLFDSGILKVNGKEVIVPKSIFNPYTILEVEDKIFIEAVRTKNISQIKSPYSDVLRTLKLTLSCNESIKNGKAVKLI